jgi:NTF2 fold immunity protein of polymorphic toxin system component
MRICAVLCSSLILAAGGLCQSAPGYKPKTGYVPDSKTAIAVAEAVLIPVYGKEHIENERPFTATLKQDVWTIEGTLNCIDAKGAKTTDCDGGVAVVKISKSDGRILYMLHGK